MSLSQQIVQACHAALEVGLLAKHQYKSPPSIIILQTENQSSLKEDFDKFQNLGFNCAQFIEPYGDMGMTAFAIEPLTGDKRNLFKNYKLWGRKFKNKDDPIVQLVQQQMREEQKKKLNLTSKESAMSL